MGKRPNETKICARCKVDKTISQFFKSYDLVMNPDNLMPYCKDCIKEMSSDEDENVNVEKFKEVLQKLNRPFIQSLWEQALKDGRDCIGMYIKNINMVQYRNATWKDSDKEISNNISNINNQISCDELYKLQDKWGVGYTNEELQAFEKKYLMLHNNYPEKTAMHTEALLTYIRYRVKEEMATAQGNVKDAKAWGELASKAASDAKINPNQLSKADLTDGLSTFGELVRAVEQAVDIISILPKFKEKPQDKVDFTLWCYINYIRDLKGLPPCEYKDIYAFYEQRKKEYEQHISFDNGSSISESQEGE